MDLFNSIPAAFDHKALGFFVQVFGWFYWIQMGKPVAFRAATPARVVPDAVNGFPAVMPLPGYGLCGEMMRDGSGTL